MAMGLKNILFGSGPKTQKLDALTPQQTQFLNQLIGMLGIDPSQLDLGQSQTFQTGESALLDLLGGGASELEQPIIDQFQNEIFPQIAQRFGGLGAQSSSGYQNALSSAGSSLASLLGKTRFDARQNALNQALGFSQARSGGLQNLANLALGTKQFGYQTTPASQGLVQGLAGALGGGVATGAGMGLARLFGG